MQATLRSNLSIVLSSTRMRLITISRYPGQLVLDVFVPIVFATLPILLGRATAGANAATVFAENTGTSNYAAYMLIGSCIFTIVSFAFWHMAYWLRWEQESGTLEALYLAPTRRVWIAAGTALYSCIRSLLSALLAYFIGSRLLNAEPIQGQTGIAFLFIAVGLVPLYGLTLLFGAVILKVKEANSLVGLMQWGVSFLMGVFFPVVFFPPVLKGMALLFPPTWMANGVRSALLGTSYFLQTWYMDLAVLWTFLFIAPAFGYWVFTRTENSVRRHEGMGQY
jgi:ABC-2 type transport system permease protein